MARAKNRLVAFALLAVLAIASLSIGNALWSETLTVTSSAATGELDVDFAIPPTALQTDVLGVADCDISGATDSTFDIAIDGAYPGYKCVITYTVNNNGTIPVSAPALALGPVSGDTSLGAFFSYSPTPGSLAAGASFTGTVTFEIPETETGHEDEEVIASASLVYTQQDPTP
jgi:hypothetical protein